VIYSFDTCSLVEPWQRNLPPDILPSLWSDLLPRLVQDGHLHATEEVKVELERQEDDLLEWVEQQAGLFVEVDEAVQVAVSEILASHPKLVSARSMRSGADPFVIALARVEDCAVVTEENPRSVVNPKIPDVCAAYGVRCIKMVDLIREQGWSFRH